MDGLIFTGGSADDFLEAVKKMYADELWLVSCDDYTVYKTGLKDKHYDFLVCKNKEGNFIGCISIAILDDDLAFVDNFFTIPEYRGRGIGTKIFNMAVTDKIREQCNVGLHSDVKVSEYYDKKQGFKVYPDVFLEVHHLTKFKEQLKNYPCDSKYRVTKATAITNDIAAIDVMVLKRSRESFLNAWIQRKDAVTAIIYSNDQPVGYGVLRKCCGHHCYILGPLYLTEEGDLLCLLKYLLDTVEEDGIVEIRIPSVNAKRLNEQLRGFGHLQKCTDFITQYTKTPPDYQYSNIYSITDTNTPV